MNSNRLLSVLLALSLCSCSAKGYPGSLPEGQIAATLSFSAGSGLTLDQMRVDGFFAGVVSRRIEIAPGTRTVAAEYNGERWLCEGERQACKVVLFGGNCAAKLEAANEGRYRARIELAGEENVKMQLINREDDRVLVDVPCEGTRRSVRYRDGVIVPGF